MSHLDAYKALASASPFFFANGDKMPSKKRHTLMSTVTFSKNGLWIPLNAVLHENWACDSLVEICTIKDGAQTYDFIADKSCSLFSIILNILSGWEVIRTHKNFWKDFVVEQTFNTRLKGKGNFWSYLNRPYEIVVVWDNRTTGNMDPRNTDA